MRMKSRNTVNTAVFDFGGVLADEGFTNGLHAIAGANNIDPGKFALEALELIYSSRYLTGESDEHSYWDAVRRHTGISGEDKDFRDTILEGFTLREWMFDMLMELRRDGVRLFMLSDQTNWLDELEERYHFFHLFEKVFNSYHTGKSKRDQSLFNDVLACMNLNPETVVFIDDTYDHIVRARNVGLKTIWFQGRKDFIKEMRQYFPELKD
ncbi:MAG TPA: HAD family phosphatase, partial [Deltaproteobacteria bacterium]|nr:HAD family phosphatase [Deltaproteobacteria bacterium]